MADVLPPQCCSLPPFRSKYEPVGETIKVKGRDGKEMDVYTTGPKNAKHGLICIYDIFGMTPNTCQGADVLAKQRGYRVVIPDFFRGTVWDHTNFPPKEGFAHLRQWIQSVGSWDLIKPDLLAIIDLLHKDGQEVIGCYGFCFGGKKVTEISANKLDIKAIAMVHPSNVVAEDANGINIPVALLPSQGEDKQIMNGFWDIIQKKPFAKQCVRKDFDDVHHGFAAARSNWDDEKLGARAREAFEILAGFFKANL